MLKKSDGDEIRPAKISDQWQPLSSGSYAQRLAVWRHRPGSVVEICIPVYGVGWQVELTFKLVKSDARLETSLATQKHRVECELYAKLITLLFFNRNRQLRLRSRSTKLATEPARDYPFMKKEVQLNTILLFTSA
jgi:hypothetical protein